MRLTTKEMTSIRKLEDEFGNLANVPEDNKVLISIQLIINKKKPLEPRTMRHGRFEWTKEIDQYLIDNFNNTSNKKLAKKLGVSINTLGYHLKQLGLRKVKFYTRAEERKLVELREMGWSFKDLAEHFDRSIGGVAHKYKELTK